MMRVDEALESLPLLARAFAAGEISSGHVRVVARVATAETEGRWLALARRLGVKALERAAAKVREGVGGEGRAPISCEAGAEAEPEPRRREIVSTAWIGGLWRRTVTLVRRLVGSPLPPGACFEAVLAEVAGEVPLPEEEAPSPTVRRAPDDPVETQAVRPEAVVGEVHASAPAGQEEDPAPPEREAPEGVDPEIRADARAIDRELRAFVTERQRQDLLLADHLRLVGVDRGYRDHGYASLEEYAADRFGLSHGSLYNLLALGRRLSSLPPLRAAFLDGRLTARQATLVGAVATVASLDFHSQGIP
jgi:hypothetical protein